MNTARTGALLEGMLALVAASAMSSTNEFVITATNSGPDKYARSFRSFRRKDDGAYASDQRHTQSSNRKPRIKGRDRNKICICGSGLKRKVCPCGGVAKPPKVEEQLSTAA
jgi:hypothetical protein